MQDRTAVTQFVTQKKLMHTEDTFIATTWSPGQALGFLEVFDS